MEIQFEHVPVDTCSRNYPAGAAPSRSGAATDICCPVRISSCKDPLFATFSPLNHALSRI